MAVWARSKSRPAEGPGGVPRRRRRWAVITSVLLVVLGGGAYVTYQWTRPYLHGTGCEVSTTAGKMSLSLEQGANSATIAAVAFRKELPERAVVIAYATAIQESHLRNLAGGDRDSVGMFQQRPSQGWGTPEQLRDPVVSTSKFYDGLVKVKDYLDKDLHIAAQEVQRSADGSLYQQHEPEGELLAAAFTGKEPATARCWFPPGERTEPRRDEAVREMRRAFGGGLKASRGGAEPWTALAVSGERIGWAVASWAVTHAQMYGLTEVRHAGRVWRAETGHDGWKPDPDAPKDKVIIR
ncbi:hypothetical protein [Actinomadura sediminis]|uniref:Heavy metal transporter n=1 Tax=Actinomadura sediminis TaxID=1038904 RepID=A0ABW3EQ64_9ACTN